MQQATYSVGADGAGFVDVYATSNAGQSTRVKDAGLGFIETRLEGDRGVYYGRYAATSSTDGMAVTALGGNPMDHSFWGSAIPSGARRMEPQLGAPQ